MAVSLVPTLAAQVDVESNRLAARTSVAQWLDGPAFRAVGDLLHRCQVAFQRLLDALFGNQLSDA